MRLRHLICEAVAKIESRRVYTFAPLLVHLSDAPRRGRGSCNNLKTQALDQARQLLRDVSPSRDDQNLSQRTRRASERDHSGSPLSP